MAKIPDTEVRQKALARLKVKQFLEKIFFVALTFPFVLALFVDRLITESNAILWISVYFTLAMINLIVWRCSNCEKQISHLRRTDFSYIPRFCRHCGVLLFPEVPPKDVLVTREQIQMRPHFILMVLVLGFVSIGVGLILNELLPIQIGGGVVFISMMAYIAVKHSSRKYCKSCGHIGIHGHFCDNCGAKNLR